MNCIDDLDQTKEQWFPMDGGGKVQFRIVTRDEHRAIRKQTVKEKVEFRMVEGTPARLVYEDADTDLQNALFWDASIVSWDEFCFRHPETKELIQCTPETCTKENKTLLMNCSRKFSAFATNSLKTLGESEAQEEKDRLKN